MKKRVGIIFFIALLVSVEFSLAQTGIAFSETGLKTALEKGKAENKPVMLWCYATWCPHCKYMKAEVFTNQTVADYFNKTFVCVAQDMEKDDGVELNKEFKIASFPTFIFYNPTGEIVYRVEGELKLAAFIAEGKTALNRLKQLPYLKKRFEKDVSNSDNCLEYIRALKKGGTDASSVANQYFATQSDNQLLSETNWMIFTNGISDINSRPFQFVIRHQKEFANIVSPERVKRKLDYEVKALLNPLVEATDTVNYPSKRTLAAQIHSYSTDYLIFNFDLKLYDFTHNWKMYAETCMQSAQLYIWNNPAQLRDMAANILKNSVDSNTLKQGLVLAQRSLSLDEEYDTYLLCTRFYKKLNDQPNAIRMAGKAKSFATKAGWDGKEANEFIKTGK